MPDIRFSGSITGGRNGLYLTSRTSRLDTAPDSLCRPIHSGGSAITLVS